MRDVAASAGVSIQTVSNVINRRFDLMTHETRARVDQATKKLGYHPNLAARSLRSARTRALGFLVLDPGNRFLADPMTDLIIAGIGDVARDRGYGLLIQAAKPDGPKPALLEPLLENRVDGVFLFLSGERAVRQWYVDRLLELGFSFVTFERGHGDGVASVTAANRDGAHELTRHLLDRGHRRIAFITTEVAWPMIEERLAGYQDALVESGIEPDPRLQPTGGVWDPSSGAELTQRLLDLGDPPSAIMGGNDLLAIGAIRAVRELGLAIPTDVAITGFDDFDFSQYVDPPLTTVSIPGYEMGRRAAERLVGELEGSRLGPLQLELPVEVRLRASA